MRAKPSCLRRMVMVLGCLLILPFTANAQLPLAGLTPQLGIEFSPAHPTPGEVVTARLVDFSSANLGSSISWRVDGFAQETYQNQRQMEFTAPPLGASATVNVTLTTPDGRAVNTSNSVTSRYLDIVFEPQTYTPASYAGRALPSVGSTMNATAILNDGSIVAPAQHIYTWQVNQTVVDGGPIRGGNRVSFAMPLSYEAVVQLTVQTLSGEVVGKRAIQLKSVSPQLRFYEVSTLFGMGSRAHGDTPLPLIGGSLTVQAVPYYLDINTYNNPDILEWSINGQPVQNAASNPYTVTLQSTIPNTRSRLELHVRNMKTITQGTQGGLIISN